MTMHLTVILRNSLCMLFMEGKRIKSKLDTVFTVVIKKFNRLVQTWNKYLEEKT